MGEIYSNSVEVVINTYGDMIFRIAFSITKNKPDADDIFQEVFLKYIKYKDKYEFKNEEHLKRWLIKVCINCGKDSVSSEWNKNSSIDDDDNPIDIPDSGNLDTNSEISLDLKNALNSIPAKYRTVIYLYYFEQLSTNDIAKAMGSTVPAIRITLSRARNALKQKLGGEYNFG